MSAVVLMGAAVSLPSVLPLMPSLFTSDAINADYFGCAVYFSYKNLLLLLSMFWSLLDAL